WTAASISFSVSLISAMPICFMFKFFLLSFCKVFHSEALPYGIPAASAPSGSGPPSGCRKSPLEQLITQNLRFILQQSPGVSLRGGLKRQGGGNLLQIAVHVADAQLARRQAPGPGLHISLGIFRRHRDHL